MVGVVVVGVVVDGTVVTGTVVGGEEAPSLTRTSSKDAVAWKVNRPTNPAPLTVLVPDATRVPSTKPVTVVPDTSMRKVEKVLVATVREMPPSTVTAPLLTAWSSTRLELSSTRRYMVVALDTRAASPANRSVPSKASGLTLACTL